LPPVSVVIATHNRVSLVGQTIDSVLPQLWPGSEIIVVDDASSDGTEAFLRDRYGERVVYHRHASQSGPSAARNTGLAGARGDFVAFLDSDDLAYPRRLEAQAASLRDDPALVLVGGQVDYYDFDLKERLQRPKMLAESDLEIRLVSLFMMPVAFPATMVRLATVRKHAIGLNPDYPAAEDYDFVLRLLRHGRARNLSEPVIKYRLHNQQQSNLAGEAMGQIRKRLSDQRMAEIGLGLDDGTRKALEQILMNPDASLKDFGAGANEASVVMLMVQGYRLLLQVLDGLVRVDEPLPGEYPALRQRLRERCLAAIGV
jgi:glycosyltransferase involved in cell wall biosynthesis